MTPGIRLSDNMQRRAEWGRLLSMDQVRELHERKRRAIAALEMVEAGTYPKEVVELGKSLFGPSNALSMIQLRHEYEMCEISPERKAELEKQMVALDALLEENADGAQWWYYAYEVDNKAMEEALKKADAYMNGTST